MKLFRKPVAWLTARIDAALTPRAMNISIDKSLISLAKPGDVIVVATDARIPLAQQEVYSRNLSEVIGKHAPGVGLFVFQGTIRSVVVPKANAK